MYTTFVYDYFENSKGHQNCVPKELPAHARGLFTCIYKALMYYDVYQGSDELLQDHWSSGF